MESKQNEEIVYEAVLAEILEIDDLGQVWRIATRRGNRWNKETSLTPCSRRRAEHDSGAYYQVRIMHDGVRVECLAQRLVWRHFYGSIPIGLTVNHKDGVKKKNNPGNLELATYSEQMIHSMNVLGQHSWLRTQNGESNRQAILTEEAVREILSLREVILTEMKTRYGKKITALAEKHNVSYQCIWDIIKGRRWAFLGA